jgi:hypothetical protein
VLSEADLSWSYLGGASLAGANLRGANLLGADIGGADLGGAVLEGANLHGAYLSRVNLTGAQLNHADLTESNLAGAVVREAQFYAAQIGWTVFADNDLDRALGLETISHQGPSHIGIDAIYRSQGNIPEAFLKGAGVPKDFIAYMKSLAGKAIEFYSCFISYSTKDQQFAERLYADLQANNVRCWFAPYDMKTGRKIHEQIDEAIRLHDKLLLILSPDSIKSAWVETEIAKARKREVRDERRVLFPVRLVDFDTLRNWECFDADTGKDSAREIREYFIPDFSDWKNHDSYQKAFQRLLKDLKAES